MSVWAALSRTQEEAVEAGVEFLLGRQGDDGLWSDFVLAPGRSDEWVTGYVGDRLAGLPSARRALERAWSGLVARRGERGGEGWGYNALVPQDADSTAWALRLAGALGQGDTPLARAARVSLAQFAHPGGMLGTYGPTEAIAAFIARAPDADLRGWTAPHACVTAAAAALPGVVPAGALEASQLPDGRWRSYWWVSDAFATALAVEALGSGPPVERAGEWALSALDAQGLTAFEAAHLLATAVAAGGGDDRRVHDAVRRLTLTMLPDGSWAPGARMRVPDPTETDPDHVTDWVPGGRIEGAVVDDVRRVFTTATVVRALGTVGSR